MVFGTRDKASEPEMINNISIIERRGVDILVTSIGDEDIVVLFKSKQVGHIMEMCTCIYG